MDWLKKICGDVGWLWLRFFNNGLSGLDVLSDRGIDWLGCFSFCLIGRFFGNFRLRIGLGFGFSGFGLGARFGGSFGFS